MKIIGSQTSPFTRVVRIACEEMHLPYEMDVTPPFAKLNDEQNRLINSHNPLMKVPILIDGGEEIVDSRIILRYLMRGSGEGSDFTAHSPETPDYENLLSVIYGVTEAGILRFILKVSNPEVKMDSGYMARSLERMGHGLAWLDARSDLGHQFGFAEAMLIGSLEWFTKRSIYDWHKFSRVVKTYETYKERESLVKTRIPESA